jgi:hypothetical protein
VTGPAREKRTVPVSACPERLLTVRGFTTNVLVELAGPPVPPLLLAHLASRVRFSATKISPGLKDYAAD